MYIEGWRERERKESVVRTNNPTSYAATEGKLGENKSRSVALVNATNFGVA